MGFFDALRRVLGGGSEPHYTAREIEAIHLGVDPDTLPIADETPFESGEYDRAQWAKKVKRVLGGLPATRPEWDAVVAAARAMAVADRLVTEDEHQMLDLVRDLIGISDAEGEEILNAVIADARSFFGGTVEGG